jgi:hypothetical protein
MVYLMTQLIESNYVNESEEVWQKNLPAEVQDDYENFRWRELFYWPRFENWTSSIRSRNVTFLRTRSVRYGKSLGPLRLRKIIQNCMPSRLFQPLMVTRQIHYYALPPPPMKARQILLFINADMENRFVHERCSLIWQYQILFPMNFATENPLCFCSGMWIQLSFSEPLNKIQV